MNSIVLSSDEVSIVLTIPPTKTRNVDVDPSPAASVTLVLNVTVYNSPLCRDARAMLASPRLLEVLIPSLWTLRLFTPGL